MGVDGVAQSPRSGQRAAARSAGRSTAAPDARLTHNSTTAARTAARLTPDRRERAAHSVAFEMRLNQTGSNHVRPLWLPPAWTASFAAVVRKSASCTWALRRGRFGKADTLRDRRSMRLALRGR
jgi:hypothetical protein